MGYFPNGISGEFYHEQYCANCIHDDPANDILCPIWALHLMRNYEECNNDKSILHELIPREGIENKKCVMFWQKPDVPPSDLPPPSTASKIRSQEHMDAFLRKNWHD